MAPLEEHELLKFVCLNKKFDTYLVREFYYNHKVTNDSLECHFRNKLIKFTLKDFDTHFWLLSKGNEFCISSAHGFIKFDLVKSTSKSVFGDPLDMAIFHISQVKFEKRILHWIIMKMLYRKPWNWDKDDDYDLYLMWVILNNVLFNWVKFTL